MTEPKEVESLRRISEEHFGVELGVFLGALLGSPNARGYFLGSITEFLLRREFEGLGFQVQRIKEKWVGPKLHHGDLYVSLTGTEWFVIESKGLKSNSERWHKIQELDMSPTALEKWFLHKREGELKLWWGRISEERKRKILTSGSFNRALMLETHFVSGTGGRSGRTIATPRKNEFHVVALDLYLRTGRHEFIYAQSEALESPEEHEGHLKQNYLIDVLVPGVDETPEICRPWTRDFRAVFSLLKNPVTSSEMQVDERIPGGREGEEED